MHNKSKAGPCCPEKQEVINKLKDVILTVPDILEDLINHCHPDKNDYEKLWKVIEELRAEKIIKGII